MHRQILAAILLAGVLAVFSGSGHARAQIQGDRWSQPYQLSSAEGRASEGHPVTDQYGYVHVFWHEQLLDKQRSIIQYAGFDGISWFGPIDIYITQSGTSIDEMSAAIDGQNTIHLLWNAGGSYRDSPIFYMSAPAYNASSIYQWSKPVRLNLSAHLIRLQLDSKGRLHILFTKFFGWEAGVYYTSSEDDGYTWSEPLWLDPDISVGYGPGSLQFALDDADGLHAVWYYTPQGEAGAAWVRYAHSLDGGNTWSKPFTIDRNEGDVVHLRTPGPVLAVQRENVHILWAGGEANYRNHRFSQDRGQTWSDPVRVFGNLNGQAFDGLAIDGAERIHFLGQIRYPQGIYHAYWTENRWVGPSLVYMIKPDSSVEIPEGIVHAHSVWPIVRAGNQLLLFFSDSPSDPARRLFVTHRKLDDVADTPLLPTPTLVLTLTPEPVTPSPQPTSTPTSTPFEGSISPEPVSADYEPGGVLWISLIPTVLSVGCVVAFRLYRKRSM